MDRVYKADLPAFRAKLIELREQFALLDVRTDWSTLRIEPLLQHVGNLERLLHARRFSRERTRLRKGVSLFRSDLVYLRTNLKALKEILAAEKRRFAVKTKAPRARSRAGERSVPTAER